MLTAKQVRRWYRIHKWASLICTGFLLMSCLTGLPLVFSEEIFQLTNHHVHAAENLSSAPNASIDQIVSDGQRLYPKQKVLSVGWDDDEPRVFVTLSPDFKPTTRERHPLAFDAHTGKLLEEQKFTRGFMYVMTVLHIELFADLPGELFLGVMAILFCVALISGVLVYGPFMRRLEFGTVRTTQSRRLKWFDLHNLLGIVTVTWGLVVGATGAMNTLSAPLFAAWRAQSIPTLLAPYKGQPLPTSFGSIDDALGKVRAVLPAAEITSVVFPNEVYGSPRHYLIWTRGKTPVTSQLFTPVLVDVVTGNVATAKPLPWYLRALEMSRPFHFGNYGGVPLKIIWALFDMALIAVLGSGVYLWLSRRKAPVEHGLDRLVKIEETTGQDTSMSGVLAR